MADRPIWQSALLTGGCQIASAGQFFPLELRPVGESIVCTPSVSGSLLPFNMNVTVGQAVTITWDSELSRYIVAAGGHKEAA